MGKHTLGSLLELSIRLETAAYELYSAWAKKFEAVPNVAAFWVSYAVDETAHAQLLKELRSRLSPDQLESPVESTMAPEAKKLLLSLHKETEIHDLEQAFQRANELEHSEINSLFEFVMTYFETEESAMAFLRAQLAEHIGRLTYRFPEQFSRRELRRAIKV